jgi:hypothetical protein
MAITAPRSEAGDGVQQLRGDVGRKLIDEAALILGVEVAEDRAQLLRVEGIDDVRAGAPVEVVEDLDGFVLRQQSEDDRGFGGRELGDEFGGRIRPEIPDGGAEGGEIAIFGQRADCGGVED